MMNKMAKKYMIERFLNHTLEIIYFLTGEEYVLVKKNSTDNGLQQLIGEVPIKFGDVSVYFSMDEWDYIEGHKEIYQDMIKENYQNLKTKEIPTNKDPGLNVNNVDVVLINNGEDEREKNSVQKVTLYPDTRVVGSTAPLKDLRNEKLDTILISEEEAETRENDVELEEIILDTGTGHKNVKTDIISISEDEEEEDDGIDKMEIQRVKIVADTCENDTVSSNLLEDSHPAASPSDLMVEDETSISYGFHGEDSVGGGSPNESTSYEGMALMSTSLCYQSDQRTCKLNDNFDRSSSDITRNNRQVKKKKTLDDIFSRNPVYLEQQMAQTEEKSYRCNECGKEFEYEYHLSLHMRIHTAGKLYKCNECDEQFVEKTHLTAHQRTHTGLSPYNCYQCGKHFNYKYQFTMHQRTHTGEKLNTCNECGKNFAYKSYLIIHQRIHRGEKPYECPRCGRCFADRSNLRKHQNTHVEETPFACLQCGKLFNSRYKFSAHQRLHTAENANNLE